MSKIAAQHACLHFDSGFLSDQRFDGTGFVLLARSKGHIFGSACDSTLSVNSCFWLIDRHGGLGWL